MIRKITNKIGWSFALSGIRLPSNVKRKLVMVTIHKRKFFKLYYSPVVCKPIVFLFDIIFLSNQSCRNILSGLFGIKSRTPKFSCFQCSFIEVKISIFFLFFLGHPYILYNVIHIPRHIHIWLLRRYS